MNSTYSDAYKLLKTLNFPIHKSRKSNIVDLCNYLTGLYYILEDFDFDSYDFIYLLKESQNYSQQELDINQVSDIDGYIGIDLFKNKTLDKHAHEKTLVRIALLVQIYELKYALLNINFNDWEKLNDWDYDKFGILNGWENLTIEGYLEGWIAGLIGHFWEEEKIFNATTLTYFVLLWKSYE